MVTKKRFFLLGIALFSIMLISGIYSLTDELNRTQTGISTSAVDIELNEYNQNNEPFDEDGKMVSPGDEIILIPRVSNLGIDCYLRTKITYTINGENISTIDYIEGNYSSWPKNGDYYYYNSVFEKKKTIELFNKLKIPNNLSTENANESIVIHIIVEAIQAQNFDNNWNDVEIIKSIDRTYNIDYTGESSIIYENGSNKHIELNEHFFNNLGNLIPGDSISEEISIQNTSKTTNEYFLNIDYDNLTNLEKELLRNIKLVIKNNKGETIISSNLGDKNKHNLGTFSPNKGDNLTIEISLPTDIDNEYSKLFAKIIWRFSYEVKNQGGNIPINPKTWDLKFDLSITVFLLSTLGFIIVLILGKKNIADIENKKERKKV